MFDTEDGALRPPSTEVLGGGLVLFCLLGVCFDIYRWIAHHRTPSLAVLYIPMLALRFLHRAFVADENCVRLPVSWWCGLGVYYLVIGALAFVEWASIDRWFLGFVLFNLGAVCYRVVVDCRRCEAAQGAA